MADKVKSSSSGFSLDFILAAGLCTAHALYCYNIYTSYTSPKELQKLSIYGPMIASVLYGSMIFFGKKIMANRAPVTPKGAMLIYNIYQSLINGFMAAWLVYQAYAAGFSVWGNYEDHSTKGFPIAFGMWMHYNNKYLELFDTFFMIVKKKDEQISFLHVYHHILLVWSWYWCIIFCIGGDAYFGASFNSLVHFFMYGYYALALFQIPCPWKKHLTMFQMIQFVFCASQSLYVFYAGNIWWFVPALQLFVMINMLYLFSKFYSKKYNKKDGAAASKKAARPASVETTSAEFDFNRAVSPSPTFSTALTGDADATSPVAAAEAVPVKRSTRAAPARDENTSSPDVEDEDVVVVKKPTSSKKKRSNKAE